MKENDCQLAGTECGMMDERSGIGVENVELSVSTRVYNFGLERLGYGEQKGGKVSKLGFQMRREGGKRERARDRRYLEK